MSTINSVKNILETDIPTTFSNFPLLENNSNFNEINEDNENNENQNDEAKQEAIIQNIREILSLFSAIAKYHKNIIWDIRTILTNNNQKYISLIQNKNNTITIYDFHIENTNIMNIQNYRFVVFIRNIIHSTFTSSYNSINGITNYNQLTNILLEYYNNL